MKLENKVPPPLVALLAGFLMWLVADLLWAFSVPAALRYTLTVLLISGGVIFDMLGILAFRASRTTVNPLKPETSSALVMTGIYRFTRNPMYVGMVLFLLAWAVYLSALLPFLGPLLFMLYITRFQIMPEERALRTKFGEDFNSYSSRVSRWL